MFSDEGLGFRGLGLRGFGFRGLGLKVEGFAGFRGLGFRFLSRYYKGTITGFLEGYHHRVPLGFRVWLFVLL